ncbi:hypothetical protein DUI87_26582 [Hirundo rustica rustica]|uniref:Uncharacterized protein n=1 Tax=Hirundo rustica rustica TaxID=333673 RepID=A0A3M0J823_HIRRU|nr:hypothetical protein DUI87_26582 [Hirundo rustica rustica]
MDWDEMRGSETDQPLPKIRQFKCYNQTREGNKKRRGKGIEDMQAENEKGNIMKGREKQRLNGMTRSAGKEMDDQLIFTEILKEERRLTQPQDYRYDKKQCK